MSRFIDLTGRVFGRLLVIGRADDYVIECKSQIHREPRWICKCSCGNPDPIIVLGSNLRRGHTKSCGCWKAEYLLSFGGHNKRENSYEICGDYAVGVTSNGDWFYVDTQDLDLVKPYSWYRDTKGYIVACGDDHELVQLHRLILHSNNEDQVDHINHDKSDNRRVNLRIVSASQNTWNRSLRKDNKTGTPGVNASKYGWGVEIVVNGVRHNLGLYKNKEDAVAARKAAEERYFGPYSYDNSMAAVPRISPVRQAV